MAFEGFNAIYPEQHVSPLLLTTAGARLRTRYATATAKFERCEQQVTDGYDATTMMITIIIIINNNRPGVQISRNLVLRVIERVPPIVTDRPVR